MNYDAGIECMCTSAWVGKYCESDKDECLTDNGGCMFDCHNHVGGSSCSCPGNMRQNGKFCLDVDECVEDAPCAHGRCIDTNDGDGYICLCDTGYTGQNCDQDINECEGHHICQGICDNEMPGYSCICGPGTVAGTGGACIEINECESEPCVHGVCVDGDSTYRCHCNRGYGGEHCEYDLCDTHLGWKLNEQTGHCYKYFHTENTLYWNEGQSLCTTHGGNLMSINTPEENTWLHSNIISVANGFMRSLCDTCETSYPDISYFVGLWVGDMQDISTWYFMDGSPVDISALSWADPDLSTSTYHCMFLHTWYTDEGRWEYGELELSYCDRTGDTVCEKENNVDLAMNP